jgi:uncharacterized protein
MSLENVRFVSPSYGPMMVDGVITRIRNFVEKEPKNFYKIIVGTDSAPANGGLLITAIACWNVGFGAIYFWTKNEPERPHHTIRDRIWAEAMQSITLGQEFRSLLKNELSNDFFWDGNEIHVDIGKNGLTKDFIMAITGLVKAYEFVPVIKPYSFVASSIADRHT